MSENMKKLLELVSGNKELAQKLNTMEKEELICAAKELGIELCEADFVQPAELSDDELDAVAGGYNCYCAVGGGGTGDDGDNKTCACVAYGQGDHTRFSGRCFCVIGGSGEDDVQWSY